MSEHAAILLFVSDGPVLSSLQFALALEGFTVADGSQIRDPSAATCLVIDQSYEGDGLARLGSLRAEGCTAPALLLATNPGPALRNRAAAAGAAIVEKPLLGEELTEALHSILTHREEAA